MTKQKARRSACLVGAITSSAEDQESWKERREQMEIEGLV
jgi:hypothetical protein